MSTTTSIVLNLDDNLPDEDAVKRLEARFAAYINRDTEADLESLTDGWDGQIDVSDVHLEFWANRKWSLEGSRTVAESLSGAYPNGTVTWVNSWDDDNGGEERAVFRAGQVVADEDMQLVSKNLPVLMAALRDAVGDGSNPVAVQPALEAARTLVNTYYTGKK